MRCFPKIIVLFIILLTQISFAQKEASIWYFGANAGLDFNTGTPVALLDGALNTGEGCATISDSSGNLLFYTDGITVWNRNHNIMLNGTDLNGDVSSTHSAIIVPKPDVSNIYYIFTVDAEGQSGGLQYSEVDMTLDGGLGGITPNKNILLTTPTSEKLTAVKSAIDNSFWVVSHKWLSNEFIAYNISNSGVNPTPVVSATGSFVGDLGWFDYIGQIKISPDGTKLAVARGERLSEVQLFDFDASTGIVSNPLTIFKPTTLFKSVYGVEFSSNSKVLYASVDVDGVYQFDLEAGNSSDIVNSRLKVSSIQDEYASLQLAIDGKIYIAKHSQFFLDAIENPDIIGPGCNYQTDHIFLQLRQSNAGLPPFIQSFFIVGFEYENLCLGETTEFKANISQAYDSLTWDFGDGNTSSIENPTHEYLSAGDYDVTLSVTSGGQTSTETKTVTIYEQPTASQPQNMLICDDDNDGFYSFDLTTQSIDILNGQSNTGFNVTYYASMIDYTNGNAIASPSSYINSDAYTVQSIVASVSNTSNASCKATTTFNIEVFETPVPSLSVPKLSFCDDTSVGTDDDGRIQFDLTQNETTILNGYPSSGFTVNYYRDSGLINFINTPSAYHNTNRQEIIYVEVVNNSNTNCKAQTSFDIEVFELPTVSPIVELKQCDDDLDGFSLFNLTEVNAKLSTNHQNETITFYETQAEADNGNNSIVNETTYTNQTVSTDAVWARIENSNNCHRTAQVNLIVSTTQIPNTYTRDFYECDDGADITDGIATFDFSLVNTEIETLFPVGQQLIIKYYRNQADALSETNPIADITNYQNIGYPHSQDVFIRVDSALDNDCLGLGHHITLHIEQQPVAHLVTIPEQCDDDGDDMYAFDTSQVEMTLLDGQTNVTVIYTAENGSTLPNPLPNPFLTASQTITARVANSTSQDSDGACFDETQIVFNVDAAAVAYSVNAIIECDDNQDGQYPFDTSSIEMTVLNGQTGMLVSYVDANNNILPSPLPNPFLTVSQTITVKVENPLSNICFDTTTIDFVVVDTPELLMNDTWLICENDTVEIIADVGFDEYLWSTGETSESITVDKVGSYEVTVTNTYNSVRCSSQKTVDVISSGIAKITDIETKDWSRSNNEITVFVEGAGDYEYSLDDIAYQDSNEFNNLNVDDYTIYVRDKNGCGVSSEDIYLMYYPHFFTPNGDGYNDTWQIINADKEPLNKIYIYDRYGKLLKQLNPSSSWDGTFNGYRLSSNDYWFVLERSNGKTYRGHFTLKI